MKLKFALVFLLLSTCLPCYADDDKVTEEAEVVYVKSARPATSREQRKTKTYEVLAQPVGLLSGHGSYYYGFLTGYYVKPWLISELSYAKADTRILGDDENYHLMEAITLGAKTFIGNSFYAKIGISYRKFFLTDTFGFYTPTSSNEHTYTAKATTYSLETGIGNQWQWHYFTFGATWIGGVWALNKPEYKYSENATDDDKDDDSVIIIAQQIEVLKVYFGASF